MTTAANAENRDGWDRVRVGTDAQTRAGVCLRGTATVGRRASGSPDASPTLRFNGPHRRQARGTASHQPPCAGAGVVFASAAGASQRNDVSPDSSNVHSAATGVRFCECEKCATSAPIGVVG